MNHTFNVACIGPPCIGKSVYCLELFWKGLGCNLKSYVPTETYKCHQFCLDTNKGIIYFNLYDIGGKYQGDFPCKFDGIIWAQDVSSRVDFPKNEELATLPYVDVGLKADLEYSMIEKEYPVSSYLTKDLWTPIYHLLKQMGSWDNLKIHKFEDLY